MIQRCKIAGSNALANFFVAQTDPIVEVTKPDDGVMIIDRPVSLKAKAMSYSMIVPISFVVVGKARSKMSGYLNSTD